MVSVPRRRKETMPPAAGALSLTRWARGKSLGFLLDFIDFGLRGLHFAMNGLVSMIS